MGAVLKRYLWVGSVLLTVAVAYLVAAMLGELLLSSLGSRVDLSQISAGNLEDDAGGPSGFVSADRPIRLDDLLAGNLFDLPAEEPDGGEFEEPEAEEPEFVAPPLAQEQIPPCPLPYKLVALMGGPASRPELGFATIEHGGRQEEFRLGYDVGGHVVMRITWNRVFLAQAGTGVECFLDIRHPLLAQASPQAPPPEAMKPPELAAPPPVAAGPQNREDRFRDAVEQSIEVVNDTDRNVQRSLINTILDNQDIAMRQARVMPHEEGGEVIGFKLYGIRRDSLFGKLGLENGDLVQSINGIPMTGADKALQAYGRLRMADQIAVTVTRRGQQLTLSYSIR